MPACACTQLRSSIHRESDLEFGHHLSTNRSRSPVGGLRYGAFFGELEHHVGSYCVVFFQCAVRYSSIPHLAPVATKFWQQSLGYMHPPVRAMIAYTYCTHSHAALCSSSAYLHYLMKDHLSPNPSLLSRRRLLRAV